MPQADLLQRIELPLFSRHSVSVRVLRLDRLDQAAPGNKAFKLRENLRRARAQGYTSLASFGGAYSNHLHALAAVGASQGLATVGVIRGERPAVLSATLQDAEKWGMALKFVDRATYRRLREDNGWGEWLREQGLDSYVIPEGAANLEGVMGCREIASWLPDDCDCVVLATATGGTLAGIAAAVVDGLQVEGVVVLKSQQRLAGQIAEWIAAVADSERNNWQLLEEFHDGGYAKLSSQLAHFIQRFQCATGVDIEPVYTAKALFALCQRVAAGCYPAGSRIVVIHTGGLQGWRGMQARYQRLLADETGRSFSETWF